jgi:hypothetical protein
MILSIGSRDAKFGKWSPSWEGPFRAVGIVPGNSSFCGNVRWGQASQSTQWEILEKVLPKCVARLLTKPVLRRL